RVAAVLGPGGDGDAGGVLGQAGDLDAAVDVGALAGRVPAQGLVHVGLGGDQDERVAGAQVGQVEPGPGEQVDGRGRGAQAQQAVGQAPAVQHLQGAGHGGEGPAGRVELRPAFQHRDRTTAPGQVTGGGQPGRACADHEDVDVM